jgi:nucleoside-diphosphate-sugar epimerase
VQQVDVRDLAEWLVRAEENDGPRGIVNAMGDRMSFAEYIDAARRAAGHTDAVIAAPTTWLVEHGVEEFVGPKSLPFWLIDEDWRGFMARDNRRAIAAGLTLRSRAETLSDVLAWELELGADRPRNSGLTAADERELLAELLADD